MPFGLGAPVGRWTTRPVTEASLPSVILMTDVVRLPDPTLALNQLPRGAAIILRHPDPDARRALAYRLRGPCRRRGISLLISADARLAACLPADGLHLPEAAVRGGMRRWRRWRRRGWLVTAAAHSEVAIRRAADLKVAAVLLAPVFPTASHPGAKVLGSLKFAGLVRRSPVAAFALGGVNASNVRRLAGSGAAGYAAIAGLMPKVSN